MTSRLSLSDVPVGEVYVVEGINAGRGLRRRLLAMGIVPGEPVRVVRAERAGPVIISVKGSRVMLGRGMAAKILIRPCEPTKEKYAESGAGKAS